MDKITITLDLTWENIQKLLKLFTPEQIIENVREAAADAVQPIAEAPKTEEPKPEELKAPEIAKADIKAAALALSKAGKKDKLIEIFEKHGGKKLSDFDKKPECYADLMKDLVAANA